MDSQLIPLRVTCKCGETTGRIEHRNGQDVVLCVKCDKYSHCAPKTETGRKVRTVQTTHEAIKPKQRYRIIERAGGKCELCGAKDILHVGHVVSVLDGHKCGLSDSELNSDENLIAACAQCNLGMGSQVLPLRVFMSILKLRAKGIADEGA